MKRWVLVGLVPTCQEFEARIILATDAGRLNEIGKELTPKVTRGVIPAASCVLLLLFTGCANPYSRFYTDQLGGQSIHEVRALITHEGEPRLYATSDHGRDSRALQENNYYRIGYSNFNASAIDSKKALRQAKKVGAAIVLIQSRYTNTVTGSIPYTVSNPSQTVTSHHSGTVYASGGYGGYSGTSTTIVPGGYTTHQIPYSVNRYDYLATFWVKGTRPRLGVQPEDLSDDLRRKIGSNSGIVVSCVVKGSPAFKADIMRGDIITRINDEIVSDAQSLERSLDRFAGQEVVLLTLRDGRERRVELRLNPSDR